MYLKDKYFETEKNSKSFTYMHLINHMRDTKDVL